MDIHQVPHFVRLSSDHLTFVLKSPVDTFTLQQEMESFFDAHSSLDITAINSYLPLLRNAHPNCFFGNFVHELSISEFASSFLPENWSTSSNANLLLDLFGVSATSGHLSGQNVAEKIFIPLYSFVPPNLARTRSTCLCYILIFNCQESLIKLFAYKKSPPLETADQLSDADEPVNFKLKQIIGWGRQIVDQVLLLLKGQKVEWRVEQFIAGQMCHSLGTFVFQVMRGELSFPGFPLPDLKMSASVSDCRLKIYVDILTQQINEFEEKESSKVSICSCGATNDW